MGESDIDRGYCGTDSEEGSRSAVEISDQSCTALDVGYRFVVEAELGGVGKVPELGHCATAVDGGAEDSALCGGTVRAEVAVEFVVLAVKCSDAPGSIGG